jgi:TRAP-type uncharacterized transport system substrate-binding protein
MEPLPKGANFIRAKTLWELGLHIAGNPATPYGGNRDMCITVGSGSGDRFRPWLRLATGSAILAEDVVRGDIEMAFVNPSALLTQAYRGTGLFKTALPVRVVAVYPSWDRYVMAFHPRLGIRSIRDIKERRIPLKLSIREDHTHSTIVLIEQMLALYDFTLKDIESWGGSFQRVGPPHDERRMQAMRKGEIDAIFDEGITVWLGETLKHGYHTVPLEPEILDKLVAIGWRKVVLPVARYPELKRDEFAIDFSGWPIYTHAGLPDQMAYDVCAAFAAREAEIPWDPKSYTGLAQIGQDTDETSLDVPLHPGAERWYREHAKAAQR